MSNDWFKIPDFMAEVTMDGVVRSLVTPKMNILTPIKQNGYHRVFIKHEGTMKFYSKGIHQLVMAAAHGWPDDGFMVRHLDGVRHNNVLSNLAYGTFKDNSDDKYIHGTAQIGSKHVFSKLTDDDVCWLRSFKMKWTVDDYKDAAEALGVGWRTVQDCVLGKSYNYSKLGVV